MSLAKQQAAIRTLPDNPNRHIFWIVYNKDMIKATKALIEGIKGKLYVDQHVTVVAKSDPSKDRSRGIVYFDPNLLDLLGNGST